jgi:hypothetical protein
MKGLSGRSVAAAAVLTLFAAGGQARATTGGWQFHVAVSAGSAHVAVNLPEGCLVSDVKWRPDDVAGTVGVVQVRVAAASADSRATFVDAAFLAGASEVHHVGLEPDRDTSAYGQVDVLIASDASYGGVLSCGEKALKTLRTVPVRQPNADVYSALTDDLLGASHERATGPGAAVLIGYVVDSGPVVRAGVDMCINNGAQCVAGMRLARDETRVQAGTNSLLSLTAAQSARFSSRGLWVSQAPASSPVRTFAIWIP